MANEQTAELWRPPYPPFRTFTNFLERFRDKALPPRIDRSVVSNLSGAQQTQLMGALEALALISDNGMVTERLRELVRATADERREIIASLLREHYDWVMRLSEINATQQQLEEAFRERGLSGDTVRKAITFFMHAAQFAEVPVSANFKTSRSAPRRVQRRTPKPNGGAQREPSGQPEPVPSNGSAAAANSRTVKLERGGSVTLVVEVDWLRILPDDRGWLLELIDQFNERDAERQDEPEEEA